MPSFRRQGGKPELFIVLCVAPPVPPVPPVPSEVEGSEVEGSAVDGSYTGGITV